MRPRAEYTVVVFASVKIRLCDRNGHAAVVICAKSVLCAVTAMSYAQMRRDGARLAGPAGGSKNMCVLAEYRVAHKQFVRLVGFTVGIGNHMRRSVSPRTAAHCRLNRQLWGILRKAERQTGAELSTVRFCHKKSRLFLSFTQRIGGIDAFIHIIYQIIAPCVTGRAANVHAESGQLFQRGTRRPHLKKSRKPQSRSRSCKRRAPPRPKAPFERKNLRAPPSRGSSALEHARPTAAKSLAASAKHAPRVCQNRGFQFIKARKGRRGRYALRGLAQQDGAGQKRRRGRQRSRFPHQLRAARQQTARPRPRRTAAASSASGESAP